LPRVTRPEGAAPASRERRVRSLDRRATHSLTVSSPLTVAVGQGVLLRGSGCDRPGLEGARSRTAFHHQKPGVSFPPRARRDAPRRARDARTRNRDRAYVTIVKIAMARCARPRLRVAPPRARRELPRRCTLPHLLLSTRFIRPSRERVAYRRPKPPIPRRTGRRCEAR
jgi:hypothetical protein